MDPHRFRADLDRKPERLDSLADALDDGWPHWPSGEHALDRTARVLMIGIGSSLYAAQVVAMRLRASGVTAIAETAAAQATLALGHSDIAVGISAGGTSAETLRLFHGVPGGRRMAVTNAPESAITADCEHVTALLAGHEAGGVACITFTHTLVALLSLEHLLCGSVPRLAEACRRAAGAMRVLLDQRDLWLSSAIAALSGPHGTWLVAPAERLSSAMQGALMLREGPRRLAVGCETGEWNHVDVYLTKSLDYRALVFPGSRWDADAARWMRERKTTVVSVGGDFPAAKQVIRYPGDDDGIVSLLVETIVPELVAAALWTDVVTDGGR